jgi:DNA-binding transcriptional MerR regulator
MEKISIGKMAKLNQVTVQTLRYYDKIGLLKPMITDDASHYRYYAINQCARLDMIQYMKSLGMSLETIKAQFDHGDIHGVDEILSFQEKWIHEKLKELQDMQKAVSHYRENIARYIKAPKSGQINLEYIEARRVFSYDAGINFYESTIDTWEYMIRGLKKQVTIQHLPMVKFCNVGSILRKSLLEKRSFYSTEIFIFVDEEEETTELLPAGDYLTVHFDDFYKEVDYGNMLLDYIKEHHYEIVGDYICEVVVELPLFEEKRNMFIKVQIPVKSP